MNRSSRVKVALTRRVKSTALMIALVLGSVDWASSDWASSLRADEATPHGTFDTGSRQLLFAFDDQSIPWIRGVELKMRKPHKHPGNPIIARGTEGQPDSKRAYKPSVLRQGKHWRMWYGASDKTAHRIAYAESDDGLNWRKPSLGLVEYDGHRDNNLVDAQPGMGTVTVIYDPDAPAESRYVMAGENFAWWGSGEGWSLAGPSITRIDTSPDGLHWTPVRNGPGLIKPQNETGTIYKFRGLYHVGGHQISPLLRLPLQEHALGGYLGPRTFVVWRSPRLDRWPIEYTRAFAKPMRSSSPERREWDREEVHLGAAVTPTGGVCLGIYGQWHHPLGRKVSQREIGDVRQVEGGYQTRGRVEYFGPQVSIDLGLILSNDGLHFREPAPGFHLIKRDQELTWDRDFRDNEDQDNFLLMQGSIVNTEDRTFVFYGATTPGGNTGPVMANIGVATLPRDRFACLQMIPGAPGGGYFVTRALTLESGGQLFANVDVPNGSSLRFSLVDEHGLETLEGYGFDDASVPLTSGLAIAVRWRDRPALPRGIPFRIRAHLEGQAKMYALTLGS